MKTTKATKRKIRKVRLSVLAKESADGFFIYKNRLHWFTGEIYQENKRDPKRYQCCEVLYGALQIDCAVSFLNCSVIPVDGKVIDDLVIAHYKG